MVLEICYLLADIAIFAVGVNSESVEDIRFLSDISGDIQAPEKQMLGYDYFLSPNLHALQTIYDIVSSGVCRKPKLRKYIGPSRIHMVSQT